MILKVLSKVNGSTILKCKGEAIFHQRWVKHQDKKGHAERMVSFIGLRSGYEVTSFDSLFLLFVYVCVRYITHLDLECLPFLVCSEFLKALKSSFSWRCTKNPHTRDIWRTWEQLCPCSAHTLPPLDSRLVFFVLCFFWFGLFFIGYFSVLGDDHKVCVLL